MTVETHREVETKFDVAPDFAMPDLTTLAKGGGRVDVSTVELVSTYHDDADLGLFRSRLTLRRRTGEDDTGWHLKVPGDGFRTELRWPLTDADGLPDELRTLIAAFLNSNDGNGAGNGGTTPIVRLRVRRTRHRLLDATGAVRVEVADDQVYADGLSRDLVTRRWREVEAELGPAGRTKDLARIGQLLEEAGAAVSLSTSKLGRALRGSPLEDGAQGTGPTTGDVINDYLGRQHDAIVAGHFALARRPDPSHPAGQSADDEAVHELRVAIRRLRATLRTFGALYEPRRALALEKELGWLGTELGAVRDCEVLRVRLTAALDALPAYLIVGPIAERIDSLLSEQAAIREVAMRAILAGPRYRAVLQELARFRSEPPLLPRAELPASELRTELDAARKRFEQLGSRMANQRAAETDLHRARRAAKRARYAGEAVRSLLGKPAVALTVSATALQTALGEYQDAVVATDALRRMADDASRAGESTFTYGVLVADQRRAAADAASYAVTLTT